jgi:hypothetical protein
VSAVAELASTQTHLQLLQGVISRMAGNSANCKTWCVTMLAGLLALSFGQGQSRVLTVGYGVVAIFYALDSYYLGLEKGYRDRYKRATAQIEANQPINELFVLEPKLELRAGMRSWSTWAVYLPLASAVALAQLLTSCWKP